MKENSDKSLEVKSTVDIIHKEMDDCCIQGNISRRKNEVENFCEKLASLIDDFSDLKAADASFSGSIEAEKDI